MKRRQKLVPWLVVAASVVAVVGSVSAQQADSIVDTFLIEQLSSPPAAEYVPNEIIVKFRKNKAADVDTFEAKALLFSL